MDIANFVNNFGGSLISLGQSRLVKAYQWLPVTANFTALDFVNVNVTPGVFMVGSSRSLAWTD